jgi:hypothetical protein
MPNASKNPLTRDFQFSQPYTSSGLFTPSPSAVACPLSFLKKSARLCLDFFARRTGLDLLIIIPVLLIFVLHDPKGLFCSAVLLDSPAVPQSPVIELLESACHLNRENLLDFKPFVDADGDEVVVRAEFSLRAPASSFPDWAFVRLDREVEGWSKRVRSLTTTVAVCDKTGSTD